MSFWRYMRSQWPAQALIVLTVICPVGWFVGLRQLDGEPPVGVSGAVLTFFAFVNVSKYAAWRALVAGGDLKLARRWTDSTYAVAVGLAILVMAV